MTMPEANCGLRTCLPAGRLADCGLQGKGKPVHAKIERLAERPKYLRASARGLSYDAIRSDAAGRPKPIDPEGGDFRAGLIRGVSLCTQGEALGHDLWLDSDFIASVASLGSESPKGVKARFTHPGLSSDGLGTFLGRLQNLRTASEGRTAEPGTGLPDRQAGNLEPGEEKTSSGFQAPGSAVAFKAIGDLHFSQAAHRTPDGDLAQYVMELAEGDPEAFAMSIVFEPDYEAEGEFILANGGKITDSGYIDDSEFVSPDPGNTRNLPHARLAALRGCDVVDEPAANPDGLFHREQQFAQEADAMMSYAVGLSASAPACVALSGAAGLHPERVKVFISKFLDAHGLQLTRKQNEHNHEETAMAEETTAEAETTGDSQGQAAAATEKETTEPGTGNLEPAVDAAAGSQEEAKPADQSNRSDPSDPSGQAPTQPQGETPSQPQPAADPGPAECGRFIAAFGAANGGQWYAAGLSFEQAQAKHAEVLAAENAELRRRLAAAGGGEDAPVAFQPSGEDGRTGGKKQFSDVIKVRGGKK